MPEATVAPDLEQPFDIFSEFGLQDVGGDLKVLSFLVVSLSVEEPSGDAVSFRVVD